MVHKYNLQYDVDTFIKIKHNDVTPEMSRQTDGINCGAILAVDIVHLIKYGRLANKDDYTKVKKSLSNPIYPRLSYD